MTDLEDKYIDELEDISNEFHILENDSLLGDISDSDTEDLTQVITRAKAAVGRIALRTSDYYAEVQRIVQSEKDDANKLRKIIGVVRGLLQDIKSGYLKSLTEIIHSDVFSDFLEMAEYLSNEGYKRASAVIAGSTLEEHLRKLCIKNGISIEATGSRGNVIPKKADLMNSELSKNSIYTVTEQKQITAWLAIRNDAAHAKDENHDNEQIQLMIQGISNFISKHPA